MGTKPSGEIECVVGVMASTLVLAVVATLLVGYFRFNWFKSGDRGVDVNVRRSLCRANFFSLDSLCLSERLREESVSWTVISWCSWLRRKLK